MTPKLLQFVFLMGLFFTSILTQDCVRLTEEIKTNLELISEEINFITEQCLREIEGFEMPEDVLLYSQTVEDIKEAFYEMTLQALKILNQYSINSARGRKYLEKLKAGLWKQVEHLNHCLKDEEKENDVTKQVEDDEMEHSGAMVFQWNYLELISYFHRMEEFLKDKKYSHCAWVSVAVGIRRCFSYYLEFAELLESKNESSSSKN